MKFAVRAWIQCLSCIEHYARLSWEQCIQGLILIYVEFS